MSHNVIEGHVLAVGPAVVAQSKDTSVDNTEPVAFRQIVSQVVGVIVTILIFKGFLEPQEGAALGLQSEVIVGALISVAGIVGAVAGRMKATSPRTAALTAVENAALPSGAPPVLLTPP